MGGRDKANPQQLLVVAIGDASVPVLDACGRLVVVLAKCLNELDEVVAGLLDVRLERLDDVPAASLVLLHPVLVVPKKCVVAELEGNHHLDVEVSSVVVLKPAVKVVLSKPVLLNLLLSNLGLGKCAHLLRVLCLL